MRRAKLVLELPQRRFGVRCIITPKPHVQHRGFGKRPRRSRILTELFRKCAIRASGILEIRARHIFLRFFEARFPVLGECGVSQVHEGGGAGDKNPFRAHGLFYTCARNSLEGFYRGIRREIEGTDRYRVAVCRGKPDEVHGTNGLQSTNCTSAGERGVSLELLNVYPRMPVMDVNAESIGHALFRPMF